MGKQNLLANVQPLSIKDTQAAGQTTITSDEVDTANCEGVLFIVKFGAIDGSAVTSVKIRQDTVTGMGTAADLLATSVTVIDSDDNKIVLIDVYKPRERFLDLQVLRATQDSVVESILAIRYQLRKTPPSDHATVVAAGSEIHVSPAEGTA